MCALVGIDAASDGLARAKRLGIATTHEGIEEDMIVDVALDLKAAQGSTV